MDEDISPILNAWEYGEGEVVARRIMGGDGRPKVQLRLDLGLLQMELDGRPDGQRPHGQESLLEHYLEQIRQHVAEFGTEAGFALDPDDCLSLQEEALQYYHRYVSLLALEDYARAERDTDRNLRVFDLVWKHAMRESDKWALERYRPYVLLMRTRARASLSLQQSRRDRALRQIEEGMRSIEEFYAKHDEEKLREAGAELAYLRAWIEEIKAAEPESELERLREDLQWAVDTEDYGRAAKIRRRIQELEVREQYDEAQGSAS